VIFLAIFGCRIVNCDIMDVEFKIDQENLHANMNCYRLSRVS